MLSQLRPAIVMMLIFTILTGLIYPLAITGVAGAVFPQAAKGSPIEREGVIIGSSLIGQNFASSQYFWPRPSATGPDPYNAGASSGSNYGATSAAMLERIAGSVTALGQTTLVPADAVTTSGSGLDPDISPAYAALQVARVATARGLDPAAVTALVAAGTDLPILGIFGEPRVNVLALNLALDASATN
ncbi:potassium-transporting ATPase subunit KdpC [uncultured Devosia sp.]|uniref:potassium-transporting ATPase subunit KdpC n=1 Tax=uncultured Devosia sp. TaxID=211434 RepID=UPI0035C9C654